MSRLNRNIRSSLFSHMPRTKRIADKNGDLSEHWYLSIMNLYQTLQTNFRSTGYLFPSVESMNIDSIYAKYQQYVSKLLPTNVEDISGLTLFDSTNRVPKIFIITYNSDNTVLKADWYTYTVTADH